MKRDISFHYDPARAGIGQILGDLELEIMEVLWLHGTLAVREILAFLKRDVSYSAVITVSNRLVQKEILERRKEGKSFLYSPIVTRKQLIEITTKTVLKRVSEIATPATVVNFLGSMIDDDQEALKELERLIELKRRQRDKQ